MIYHVLPLFDEWVAEPRSGIALNCHTTLMESPFLKQSIIFCSDRPNLNPNTINRTYILNRYSTRDLYTSLMVQIHSDIKSIEIHNSFYLCEEFRRTFPKIPMITYAHNLPIDTLFNNTTKLYESIYTNSNMILCTSEFIRNRFIQTLNLKQDDPKLIVSYDGFDTPEYIETKEKIIVCVGRLHQGKGILEFLKGIELLKDSLGDWKIQVIGRDYKNQYSQTIIDMCKRLPNTEYLGEFSFNQTMEYVKRASVAIVPSVVQEPLGRTAIEAAKNSCYLITSNKGGLPEINTHGHLLTDVTPVCIANTLKGVIQLPEEALSEKRLVIYNGIKDRFLKSAMFKQVNDIRKMYV